MEKKQTPVLPGSSTHDLAARTLGVLVREVPGTALGALAHRSAYTALPFGGQYSSIDFPLSNCINSGIARVTVLTEHAADTWLQHGRRGPYALRPARQAVAPPRRPTGTAAAVYHHLELIEEFSPAYVLVHVGEDVSLLDYRPLLETHVASGFGATIACIEAPTAMARDFGVVDVGQRGRVVRYLDKPARLRALPPDSASAVVSMGTYVFDTELLVDCLSVDAEDRWSAHDFGLDLLPLLIRAGGVGAHVFRDSRPGQCPFWRELGTVDRYWRANLELLQEQPAIDFANRQWPLLSRTPPGPSPRVFGDGTVSRSIVSVGCVIGGCVTGSVLSPECFVPPTATVLDSVLLAGVRVGRGSRICKAVVDAACVVPDGFTIGEDAAKDAAYFEVSADGVALVTTEALARATTPRGAVDRSLN